MRSSILIIYTGGTIGMKTDAATGALVPFDFSGIYDEFPSLKRLNVDIDVSTPMTEAIIRPRVQPEESPRQCRPLMLVSRFSSIFTLLE